MPVQAGTLTDSLIYKSCHNNSMTCDKKTNKSRDNESTISAARKLRNRDLFDAVIAARDRLEELEDLTQTEARLYDQCMFFIHEEMAKIKR